MNKVPPKKRAHTQKRRPPGSWEGVNRWYDNIVGEKGHYYHQNVILPNVERLLDLPKPCRLLDIGCGQGVLARHLEGKVQYTGIDIAPSLIKSARQKGGDTFVVGDATRPLPFEAELFDRAVCLLAIQDMERADAMIAHVSRCLKQGGKLLIVMNHPCFRIPRASSWQEEQGTRYRRVNGYMVPRAIPIQSQPSRGELSQEVTSYHRPLSSYFQWLAEAGLVVETLEEWVSDKESSGSKARMENRAREEFPLFLCLVALKMHSKEEEVAPSQEGHTHTPGRRRQARK